jgi:hypothetical protein
VTTLARRRSRRDDEPEAEREERPTRRRRSPSGDDKGGGVADEPRRRRSRDEEPEDEPRGRRSRGRSGRAARSGSGGFSSYSQKKRSTGSYADDFKVEANKPTLIKLLDAEPFDVYNEHWLDEFKGTGARLSYVCLDDEYFTDEDEKYRDEDGNVSCPLCGLGERARTKSLFNVLDLTNPRKPEVKVWSTPPSVTDIFERMAGEKKTQPLDREDLYFEVTLNKKSNKFSWAVVPVKARDLPDDYDIDPFDADDLNSFGDDLFTDRTAVTKIDTYDELDELAESLD